MLLVLTFSLEILTFHLSCFQRGSDVPHSPVMYAYLLVETDRAQLFVDDSKVTSDVKDYLENAGVDLRPYDYILSEIER